MTYYIEENDFLDFSNSVTKVYDCIDEKSPYLAIIHNTDKNREGYYRQDSKTSYCCVFVSKQQFVNKTLIVTTSKDELKIWMDLNGLKMTGEKIVVGHVDDKLDIYLEAFELNNV